MLTVENLKALGNRTEEGLTRCMNNEMFYLRLVGMALADDGFEQLKGFIEAGDLDSAFEKAHAMKSVYGNVALTTIYDPVSEITEELRAKNDIDYAPYLDRIEEELKKVKALL